MTATFLGFTDQAGNPLTAVAVPEPSTMLLVIAGLISALHQKRKKPIPKPANLD